MANTSIIISTLQIQNETENFINIQNIYKCKIEKNKYFLILIMRIKIL